MSEETEQVEANETVYDWSAYYDDEGRLYYYNSVTDESSWDPPEEGFNPPEEEEKTAAAEEVADESNIEQADKQDTQVAAAEQDEDLETSHGSKWVVYQDNEGRDYFYNTDTGETQWEKPDGEVILADGVEEDEAENLGGPKASESTEASETRVANGSLHETTLAIEVEENQNEELVDPAARAEEALNQPDSVLEPDCMNNVTELVTSEGGNPQKAISALIDHYVGQTAVCGLLARWIADIRSPPSTDQPRIPSEAIADEIRAFAQDILNKIVKERFTKEAGDAILNLSKSEAAFLEEMMDSPRWRKLLIDLSATHKNSALLVYCLRSISRRGHHREIARRINQSDHFAVFNAMLQSEIGLIGQVAVSAASDITASIGLDELISDLRRACTCTAYTYLFSTQLLRYLTRLVRQDMEPLVANRFMRVLRKWEVLVQDIESSVIDPASSSSIAVSSPLFRKRRLEVALTLNDLSERKIKRNENSDHAGANGNAARVNELEAALLTFLRRHAAGIQIDDAVLDPLLPQGLDLETDDVTGNLLVRYPLAVKALLGYIYKSRASRVSAPSVKNKCARLIALATIASEKAAINELGESDHVPEPSNDVSLTNTIIQGSQLCEQLETMVSFLVTNVADTALPLSPGQKLCSLATKCAAVAQGVVMWVRDFTHGSEFAASASFPTLSVSILSMVRIVCLEQPFVRKSALDIAIAFLRHSNSEVSYQKISAIKEQTLRLLIVLLMKGEVVLVLGEITARLDQHGSSDLDASLIRYFVRGVLEVVCPPVSLVFMRTFGDLLMAPRCLDALRSTYFGSSERDKLIQLLHSFKNIQGMRGDRPKKEDAFFVASLLEAYKTDSTTVAR